MLPSLQARAKLKDLGWYKVPVEAVQLAEDMKALETMQSILKHIEPTSITRVETLDDIRKAEKALRDLKTLLAKWHRTAWDRMRHEYLHG